MGSRHSLLSFSKREISLCGRSLYGAMAHVVRVFNTSSEKEVFHLHDEAPSLTLSRVRTQIHCLSREPPRLSNLTHVEFTDQKFRFMSRCIHSLHSPYFKQKAVPSYLPTFTLHCLAFNLRRTIHGVTFRGTQIHHGNFRLFQEPSGGDGSEACASPFGQTLKDATCTARTR